MAYLADRRSHRQRCSACCSSSCDRSCLISIPDAGLWMPATIFLTLAIAGGVACWLPARRARSASGSAPELRLDIHRLHGLHRLRSGDAVVRLQQLARPLFARVNRGPEMSFMCISLLRTSGPDDPSVVQKPALRASIRLICGSLWIDQDRAHARRSWPKCDGHEQRYGRARALRGGEREKSTAPPWACGYITVSLNKRAQTNGPTPRMTGVEQSLGWHARRA